MKSGSTSAAAALEETVRMRLMSDVPLGMFSQRRRRFERHRRADEAQFTGR